ncbi:hypothetical protein GCM10012275_56070 [Longimycelium tulufanense]|uniref:Ribulose bisphosphate carboxylase large subunit C-terminal domain-containing protein n=1 Tax=Longimycelium tulufanense TaxID=907463 RepID=A0A8J3FXB3_9PSEU|nr:RuBisCO large subunit C-terminal-like domain-containing protein [Longimycelium tulufanense]GGM78221.1 hypothetical protein GCM10012275_56070 [Longimycelium tulufanense]
MNSVVTRYWVRPHPDYGLRTALELVAEEAGVGICSLAGATTLRILPGSDRIRSYRDRVGASFEVIDQGTDDDGEWAIVDLAVPEETLLRAGNAMAAWLTVFAGDIFGLRCIRRATALGTTLAPAVAESLGGPRCGWPGLARLLGHDRQDLSGVILKPNLGMSPEEIADLVGRLADCGIDFVKDDELNMCPVDGEFEKRIRLAQEAIGDRPTLYAVNITSPVTSIVDNAHRAVDAGASAVMVNGFIAGLPVLHELARADIGVPIHVHRAMGDLFLPRSEHGITLPLLSLLARLAGADLYHIGTPVGASAPEEIREAFQALVTPIGGIPHPTVPISTRASVSSRLRTRDALGDGPLMHMACGAIWLPPVGITSAATAFARAVRGQWGIEESLLADWTEKRVMTR